MKIWIISLFLVQSLIYSASAWSQQTDDAYLDPAYDNLIHPKIDDQGPQKNDAPYNDVLSVLESQSPVRSQGRRGTCSIFSATALVEFFLVAKGELTTDEADLSEQYLQYIVNAGSTSEGSNAARNFSALLGHSTFGKLDSAMVSELTMPYNSSAFSATSGLGLERCGHLQGRDLKSCVIVQRDPNNIRRSSAKLLDSSKPYFDPELVNARQEAKEFKQNYLSNARYKRVFSTSEAKEYLRLGLPVILELDFYYGAWNHSRAPGLGINRNMDEWAKGIVTHAPLGSVDRIESKKERAGHSILLVGYDDTKVVQTQTQMSDGTKKTLDYRGVYYFKNSWGTDSFGKDFEIEGKNFPGYGMITQEYAHSEGSFYFFTMP